MYIFIVLISAQMESLSVSRFCNTRMNGPLNSLSLTFVNQNHFSFVIASHYILDCE